MAADDDFWKTVPLPMPDLKIFDMDDRLYRRELMGTFTHDAVEIGVGRALTPEDIKEAMEQLQRTPVLSLSPMTPSGRRTFAPIVINPPYAGRSKTMIGMQLAKQRANIQVSTLECDYDEIEARLQALKEKAAKQARIRMFRFDAEWFSE